MANRDRSPGDYHHVPPSGAWRNARSTRIGSRGSEVPRAITSSSGPTFVFTRADCRRSSTGHGDGRPRNRPCEEAWSGAFVAWRRGRRARNARAGRGLRSHDCDARVSKTELHQRSRPSRCDRRGGFGGGKRASLVGRGPTLGDVHVAMDLFDIRTTSPVSCETTEPFAASRTVTPRNAVCGRGERGAVDLGANDAASHH